MEYFKAEKMESNIQFSKTHTQRVRNTKTLGPDAKKKAHMYQPNGGAPNDVVIR